jgi:hypothetical protein
MFFYSLNIFRLKFYKLSSSPPTLNTRATYLILLKLLKTKYYEAPQHFVLYERRRKGVIEGIVSAFACGD